MAAGRFTYDPSNTIVSIDYMVAEAGDPWFVAAYPIMDEEQQVIEPYYSENGIRTNLEDGTNTGPAPRDYTTACAFDEAAFDAYKAAQLAQCEKLVGSTAVGVVPATNVVTLENKGTGVEAE
jgi:hypothetical protein